MSMDTIKERYDEFSKSDDKVKSLVKFMMSARNTFYELAFTLSDEDKIKVMEFYYEEKATITNLICKLSTDELKISVLSMILELFITPKDLYKLFPPVTLEQ